MFAPYRLGYLGVFCTLWSLSIRSAQSIEICHTLRCSGTELISLYKVMTNIRGVLTEVTPPGWTKVTPPGQTEVTQSGRTYGLNLRLDLVATWLRV